MSQLSISEYRRNFVLESSRLAAIQPDQFDEMVSHLDGWTVRNVVEHAGAVLRFASLAMTAEPDAVLSRSDLPEPPEGPALLGWFEEAAKLAVETMDTLDVSSMRPTWAGPRPAAWYVRRLTHEISVHRWDAQSTISEPDPIDPDLAVDGIDELLEVYVPKRVDFDSLAGKGETVHLHATDHEDGEWLLTFEADRVAWEHSHTKADVAARGSASALLLLLWGRQPRSGLEIFGDDALLARWNAAASF